MIGIDESEAELAGLRDFPNEIGFASGMNAHGRNEIGNQIGNLEAGGTRGIDDAMRVPVDGFDSDPGAIGMLAMNRGRNDSGGKAGERADFNNAARREDTHHTGEKKTIARTDAAGIADIIQGRHGVKKIHFARRGNFSRVAEFIGQLPILNLEFLPIVELADIETAGASWGRDLSNRFAHLAHEIEPAPDRAVTPKMEALSERKFHGDVIFAAATLTNKWLLRAAPKRKGG